MRADQLVSSPLSPQSLRSSRLRRCDPHSLACNRSGPRDFVAAILTHLAPNRSGPRDFVAAILTHLAPNRSGPRDFVAAILTHLAPLLGLHPDSRERSHATPAPDRCQLAQ